MQIPWKKVLGLLLASSAMSCGDSDPYSDPYQGFIDASALDAKFRPASCTGGSCYQTQIATVNSDPVVFFNLGLVANSDKTKPPAAISAEGLATTVYEFPEGCSSERPYDRRLDAFAPDEQYPVFSRLPLATTSSSAPPVLPLVKLIQWTGSDTDCNAIKDVSSVDEGSFSVTQQEGYTVALRPVVAPVEVRLSNGTKYMPPLGWYKGLLLNYLDGGQVPVDAEGNIVPMDGVIVNPATGSASTVTANNVLVLFARPGEVGWSPVVRLREFKAVDPAKPGDYKSLCYDAPCAANAVDMSKATTYAGTLFLIGGAP